MGIGSAGARMRARARLPMSKQPGKETWDFGDGTFSSVASPTHTFPVGVYNIRLTITTQGGCSAMSYYAAGVTVSTKPTANFSANPRDVCAHVPINFTDLSTGTVTEWQWDFGDGGTASTQNPTHIYETDH